MVAARTRMSGFEEKTKSNGATETSDRMSSALPQEATSSPAAPPKTASRKPSVQSCRTIRPRAPPIASRIAISLWRADPRASIMLARLSEAINRTTAGMDIVNRMTSGTDCPPSSGFGETLSRASECTINVWSLFSAGYAFSIRDATTASWTLASRSVSPDFNRPIKIK
jgi:hypothetical protein